MEVDYQLSSAHARTAGRFHALSFFLPPKVLFSSVTVVTLGL
jgi:hypothetical protein